MDNPFTIIQSDLKEVKGLLTKLLNKPKEDLSNKLYTVEEAAILLVCSKQTVRNRIKSGSIKAFKIGDLVRIKHTEIYDSLNEVKSIKYKR